MAIAPPKFFQVAVVAGPHKNQFKFCTGSIPQKYKDTALVMPSM